MVLDTRFLDTSEQSWPASEADSVGATLAPAAGLDQLLQQVVEASGAAEYTALVQQLRQTIPSAEGLNLLWEIAATPADPRRHAAVLMLGHHREWLTSKSRVRSLIELIFAEKDAGINAMLVWCLRQQDEVARFVNHEEGGVAREAALGVPLGKKTLPIVLDALLCSVHPHGEVGRVLLHKLRGLHPSLVRCAIDHLLAGVDPEHEHRLPAILECLPQLPLFQILIEERELPAWDPHRKGDAQRVQIWQQLVAGTQKVLMATPGHELARYLLTRSAEDEVFARRHVRLIRAAVRHGQGREGDGLVDHFERLTQRATEDKVARLAQILVELAERLEGEPGKRARSLLEEWKNRSIGLRLRIYQMENGLGG